MTAWVVMSPPPKAGPDATPEFVRDRFSVWGFIAPPLWLAWHRLWLEALVALVVMLAIPVVAMRLGIGPAASWLSLIVSIYVGLEGPALKLAALRRGHWRDEGVFEADDLEEAEIRYAAETVHGPWGAGRA